MSKVNQVAVKLTKFVREQQTRMDKARELHHTIEEFLSEFCDPDMVVSDAVLDLLGVPAEFYADGVGETFDEKTDFCREGFHNAVWGIHEYEGKTAENSLQEVSDWVQKHERRI